MYIQVEILIQYVVLYTLFINILLAAIDFHNISSTNIRNWWSYIFEHIKFLIDIVVIGWEVYCAFFK